MVSLKFETTTDSLSDERIVQLRNACAGVLGSTDNEYYRSTVENILQRYATKKANLINLMRKHPEWDEQNLAIIQTHEFNRTIDLQLAKELINAINDTGEVDTYYMADYDSVEHVAMGNQVYCVLSEFHKMVGERWNTLPLDALKDWQSSLHIRKFYKRDTVLGVRKNPDTREYTPTNIEVVEFVPYEGSNLEHQNLHKFVAENGILSALVEEHYLERPTEVRLLDRTLIDKAKIRYHITDMPDTRNSNYTLSYAETEEGFAELLAFWDERRKNAKVTRENTGRLEELLTAEVKSPERIALIERLEKLTGTKIGKQLKTTRILRRYFDFILQSIKARAVNEEEYHARIRAQHTMERYERKFAELSDALTEKTFKRETVLSVHPVDYLLMSNGGYSDTDVNGETWESCHNIVDGCHKSGTISYMLDNCSLIGYTTVVEENRNNMAHRYKINRQVQLVFPEGQALLSSRLYPNYRANATFDLLSGVVRDMIVTCTGNSFDTVVDSIDAGRSNSRYASCDSNATLYPDWTYREYHTRLYSCGDASELEPLSVGAAPLCVKCGDRHSDAESLCCSDCQ